MKKDIKIPEVKNLKMAMVYEFNEIFQVHEWNAYIINEQQNDLEVVIIVSQGFSLNQATSQLRKTIDVLPAHSFAKVEYVTDDVLSLNNRFQISYFLNNTVYEKTFVFPQGSICQSEIKPIEILNKEGIVID